MSGFDDLVNSPDEDTEEIVTTGEDEITDPVETVKEDPKKDDKEEPDYMKYISGESKEEKKEKEQNREEEILTEYGVTKEELSEARRMGWKDKNGFEERNGKKFVDPKTFLSKAKDNANVYRERFEASQKKLAEQDDMIANLTDKVTKIVKKQFEDQVADLERKIKEYEGGIKDAKEGFEYDKVEELAREKTKTEIAKEELLKKSVSEEAAAAKVKESIKSEEEAIKKSFGIDDENLKLWKENTDPVLEDTWYKKSSTWKEIQEDPVKFEEYKGFAKLLLQNYPSMASAQRLKAFERRFASKNTETSSIVDGGNSNVSSQNVGKTGWDSLTKLERDLAINTAKNFAWWRDKDSNPKSKAKWEQYKSYYDQKEEE